MPQGMKDAYKNPKFSDDKRAKGFNQGGLPSKNPTEVHTGESHDTSAERADNAQREDSK